MLKQRSIEKEKVRYGTVMLVIGRSTFLIDPGAVRAARQERQAASA